MESLIFVHEGKAAYPEVAAGIDHFALSFKTMQMNVRDVETLHEIGNATCWHMMGLYRKRLPARRVIHDYRSLSVGRGRRWRDLGKRYLNHRPDLRIYQNEQIRDALGFRDDVPELLLPMGVPNDILQYRMPVLDPASDEHGNEAFCYIGSLLPERRMDLMIDSFLRRYSLGRKLHLFGTPEPSLQRKYATNVNVVFQGTKPQADLFKLLPRFAAAVCYFPNHYPHLLQTPTKMLEYAALGMRVIANEHPQSRIASVNYGISCHWGPSEDMFANAPDNVDWPSNAQLDPRQLLWSEVYKRSRVDTIVVPGW